MHELLKLLSNVTPGRVQATNDLERAEARCWDEFEGADEGGMEGHKVLGRMESVEWYPPLLEFAIERHGGTVLGSTRAEVQHWTLDLEAGTADITGTRRRQLYATEAAFTTPMMRAVVEDLVPLIQGHHEDDRLRWKPDGRVHVVVSEIIGPSCQQTDAGRRRRMRGVLEEVLGRHGWFHEGCNVFRRKRSRKSRGKGGRAVGC